MHRNLLKLILFNRWSAFLHDVLWIPVALVFSYLLRFNFEGIPREYIVAMGLLVAISVPVQGGAFWLFGMYRGLWRFASIPDLFRILKAVAFGALCVTVIVVFATRLSGIPRSVLILYPLLLTAGLSLPRLLYRWYKDKHFMLHKKEGKRIIIIGAGNAGQLLLRDLFHQDEYQPLGFLDDDPRKQEREIHGVPILGIIDDLKETVKAFSIDEVVIAIPSASQVEMRRIMEYCRTADISACILPTLREMKNYQVSSSQLRPLSIEDLLGRDAIKMDNVAIQEYLTDQVVLVTGGGGSIGSELCRQILENHPARLIIFDHSEYNLYSIEHELRVSHPDVLLTVVLGDVKNQERVDWVFRKFAPKVVFHAAAYKHVPMLEVNPAEGVQNNVFGSKVLADTASKYEISKFVFVSTDKAVNPANVMGTTKRIAEIYCQNLNVSCSTSFITTRFGNVLGSSGSVVPLFQKQIESGGPVTVTHPDIKRFFMTIPESVSLILQAGAMGEGGEIFVLDMGEPVLIRDMAEQMIRLSGFEPENDIKIVFTGLRSGEKLYEELLHESEGLLSTEHPKLLLARSREVDWEWLVHEIDDLLQAAILRDVGMIKDHLRNIVPEYTEKKNLTQ